VTDVRQSPSTIAGAIATDTTVVSGAPAPRRIGRYALLERLGVGGMAEVYLAQQDGPVGFQKKVVIKRILPHLAADPQFVDMFAREARVAARLSHANVVQIFELGEGDGELTSAKGPLPASACPSRAVCSDASRSASAGTHGIGGIGFMLDSRMTCRSSSMKRSPPTLATVASTHMRHAAERKRGGLSAGVQTLLPASATG
jgi:hypothetical protein